MYCVNCGKELKDGTKFCIYCGENLEEPEQETVKDLEQSATCVQEPKVKKEKKKPKTGLIIILTVLVLIVGLGVWGVTATFPLEVSYDEDAQELVTKDCKFNNFKVEVKANQPIRSIKYALNPSEEDEIVYSEGKMSGKLFRKDFVIESLIVPPGEATLVIHVQTLFGQDDYEITLESDMGHAAAPEENSFVEVSEGTYLVSNELLIKFKKDIEEEEIKELVDEYDGEIVGQIYILNQYQIRFTGKGENYINGLKEKLEKEEIVQSVYFNLSREMEIEAYPNDKEYEKWDTKKPSGNNWGLECIDAPGAWEYQDEMSVVKMGIVDSSLQNTHTDLEVDKKRVSILATDDFKTMKDLWDYYAENDDSHECINEENTRCNYCSTKEHGTHVTGIAGALSNNEKGVAGVNWNSEIYFSTFWYHQKADNSQLHSSSPMYGWMYSITRMIMSGCRVVNVSVGSSEPSEPDEYEEDEIAYYNDMIKGLEDAGYDFLIVKSAGNSNDDASRYWLNRVMTGGEDAAAHTIMVGAVSNASSITNRLAAWMADTEKIYNMASYSNYGELIDVTAPGTDIYNTVPYNAYDYKSGTSMATPTVSGVVALAYSINPDLTYDTVKTIVCCTGDLYCAKNGEVYPIVNAKNTVEWIREHGMELPELKKPTVGFVTGLIQDAETMELIENAAVYLTNNENNKAYESMVEKGTYYCYLPSGTYTMQFAAEDYVTETVYNVEISEGVVNYNVLLNLVPEKEEKGIATGRIVDAFDASSIPNASLIVYRGINQKSGEPVTTTKSDENGNYTLTLEPGNYTIHATATDYTDSSANIIVIGDKTKNEQHCTMTPILKEGEIRIVLTWGDYPRDLDSHLVGPAPDGKFHTFYSNKNYRYNGTLYDNLDVDDTSSYGPETTSVYVGQNGKYTFFVHDFSNKSSSTSSAMATSGVQVKVYVAGQSEPVVYNAPNQPGTLWTVCSIENGQITPINTMGYHSDPRTIGQ